MVPQSRYSMGLGRRSGRARWKCREAAGKLPATGRLLRHTGGPVPMGRRWRVVPVAGSPSNSWGLLQPATAGQAPAAVAVAGAATPGLSEPARAAPLFIRRGASRHSSSATASSSMTVSGSRPQLTALTIRCRRHRYEDRGARTAWLYVTCVVRLCLKNADPHHEKFRLRAIARLSIVVDRLSGSRISAFRRTVRRSGPADRSPGDRAMSATVLGNVVGCIRRSESRPLDGAWSAGFAPPAGT